MALFAFVFFLLKTSLLAGIYALPVTLLIYYCRNRRRFMKIPGKQTMTLHFWISVVAFVCLLIFSSTFLGDRGFYDTALLPVSNGTAITCGDGVFTYIQIGHEQHLIGSFALHDGKIFAEDHLTTMAQPVPDNLYLMFDPSTSELKQFNSSKAYEQFALQNNYPSPSEFREFFEHYNAYWSGWRFWLLP